jgi:archaemetzincin
MKISAIAPLLISFFLALSCGKTGKNETPVSALPEVDQPQKPEARTEEKLSPMLQKIDQLKTLDIPMEKPKPWEWLATNDEKGQSFAHYKTIRPVRPGSTHNIIYILPIGDFTPAQYQVVQYTTNYIRIFFGLQTILSPPISDAIIPQTARRGRSDESEQLNSMYILNSVLVDKIPKNGLVLMAITAKDLYPADSWNYVFGQANAKKRVAVSSIYRYSDVPITSKNYNLCLSRLTKTSAHEIGHMFSINHCIYAKCLMNGSNSLRESDEGVNHLCTDCYKKLYWNLQFDPVERNKKLITFFKSHRSPEEVDYHKKALAILQD